MAFPKAGRGRLMRRKTYRRRRFTRKRKVGSKSFYSLKKRVSALDKSTTKIPWQHFQGVDSGSVTCDANKCIYGANAGPGRAAFFVADRSFGFLNDSNAAILGGSNASTANLRIYVKRIIHRFEFKNNTNVPCWLTLYCLKMKKGLDQSPYDVFAADVALNGMTGTPGTELAIEPIVSARLQKYCTIKRKKVYMLPGQVEVLNMKGFGWNVSYNDYIDASVVYPRSDQYLIYRVHGDVCHDETTATLVGTAPAKIDYVRYFKYVYGVKSGISVPRCLVTNDFDTITGAEGMNVFSPAAETDFDPAA